jgi:hypothetical protein
MPWTVVTLGAVVDGEIAALPTNMRARLVRLTELIEQIGFDALPRNSVKHLEGGCGSFASPAETESPGRSTSRRSGGAW